MWTTITAYITAHAAQILGSAAVAVLSTWLLGRLSGTKGYKTFRAWCGRHVESIGETVSNFGETKFGKAVWNPIEELGMDFVGFQWERFCVGLRKNNLAKLEKQLERLEDVGSKNQAEAVKDAIRKKMEHATSNPPPTPTADEAEVFQQAFQHIDESAKDKLGE